jgi:diguanylate cyclase (GGDEF)-like protein
MFNDNYGHSCGDKVLIEVAKILQKVVGEEGVVFRYAGDEFTIIIPNGNETDAEEMCKRISSTLDEGFPYNEFQYEISRVSISAGYACFPAEGGSFAEIIDLADKALYYAKKEGGGTYYGCTKVKQIKEQMKNSWPPVIYCRELVGREKELSQLRNLVLESKSGLGQVILIEGEAGIGKSRLMRHFAKSLRVGDYNIIIGECSNSTIMIPYHPFREGLSHCFEAKDPRMLQCYRSLDKTYRRELIKFIPSFIRYETEKEVSGDSEIDKFMLYQSILNLLVLLSKQLPVILILDDIHWADEASLNLIVYLAKQCENERILICTCFREEEAPNSNFYHLIKGMSRESRIKHMLLERLTEDALSLMIDKIFEPHILPSDFKKWMHSESEGNPFYAEEIIKSLIEEGRITKRDSQVVVEDYNKISMPHSIKELILRRILRLSINEQRILGYASVIGQEFRLDLLYKLLEEDESYVLDVLEKARKAFIIKELHEAGAEKFAFYHNKIRETIYLEMGFIRRKKLHLRLAELLENLYADNINDVLEMLAFHYDKAQRYDKAYKYSILAAQKALNLHSYNQALKYYEACLGYKEYLSLSDNEIKEIEKKVKDIREKHLGTRGN